jgi:hypothetical protein
MILTSIVFMTIFLTIFWHIQHLVPCIGSSGTINILRLNVSMSIIYVVGIGPSIVMSNSHFLTLHYLTGAGSSIGVIPSGMDVRVSTCQNGVDTFNKEMTVSS